MARKPAHPLDADLEDEEALPFAPDTEEASADKPHGESFPAPDAPAQDLVDPAPAHTSQQVTVGLRGVGRDGSEPVTTASTQGRIVAPPQPLPFDPEVEAARRPTGKAPEGKTSAEALMPGVNIPLSQDEAEPPRAPMPVRAALGRNDRPHLINGFPAYDVPENQRVRAPTYPPPTEDAPVHLGITSEQPAKAGITGSSAPRALHELNAEAWRIDDRHAEKAAAAADMARKVIGPMLDDVPRRRGAAGRRTQKDLTALPPEIALSKNAPAKRK